MFTTVAAYSDPMEAQLALGLLQAEGIPARLDDIGTAIANWEWRLAIGGIRLRVPEAQAIHARRVLAALEAGEYALEDEGLCDGSSGDDGDGDRNAGMPGGHRDRGHPSPGTGTGALQPPSRETLSSRIAWAAFMLLGLPLPWRRRRDDGSRVREL